MFFFFLLTFFFSLHSSDGVVLPFDGFPLRPFYGFPLFWLLSLWFSGGLQAASDFETTSQRPQRAHLRLHAFKNTTKFHETTPGERQENRRERKKNETGGGREKTRNLGPPALRGSALRGPTPNRAQIGRAPSRYFKTGPQSAWAQLRLGLSRSGLTRTDQVR